MTASNRTRKPSPKPEIGNEIDVENLIRRKPPTPALHLNLRLGGDNAEIYQYLVRRTPVITDSLRIRDCIRLGAFLVAMKEKSAPVLVDAPDGRRVDLLEYIGAFYPQTSSDTRKRS
jgi:hypothetical protein